MLLNNVTGSAAGEGVGIAAQKRGRARLPDRDRDFQIGWLTTARHPDAQHITFAIRHRDDAVRRDFVRALRRLIDDLLNVGCGQLRARWKLTPKNATPMRTKRNRTAIQ